MCAEIRFHILAPRVGSGATFLPRSLHRVEGSIRTKAGIFFASTIGVVRISEIGPPAPRLLHGRWSWALQLVASLGLHAIAASLILIAAAGRPRRGPRLSLLRQSRSRSRCAVLCSSPAKRLGSAEAEAAVETASPGPFAVPRVSGRTRSRCGRQRCRRRRRRLPAKSPTFRRCLRSCSMPSHWRQALSTRWGSRQAACPMAHRPGQVQVAALVKAWERVSEPDEGRASVPAPAVELAAASIDQATPSHRRASSWRSNQPTRASRSSRDPRLGRLGARRETGRHSGGYSSHSIAGSRRPRRTSRRRRAPMAVRTGAPRRHAGRCPGHHRARLLDSMRPRLQRLRRSSRDTF